MLNTIVLSVSCVAAALVIVKVIFDLWGWKNAVDTDRQLFQRFVDTTFHRFAQEMRGDIKKILHRLPSPTVSRDSPIQLTNLGQDVSNWLDAKSWARTYAEQISAQGTNIGGTAYDIQEYAFDHVTGPDLKLDSGMEKEVKESAFKTGISRDQVLEVLAVELRDRHLLDAGIDRSGLPDGEQTSRNQRTPGE